MAYYRTHSSVKFKALTLWRAPTVHSRGRVWKSLEGFIQMWGITHNAFQEAKELEFLVKRRRPKWQLAGLQKHGATESICLPCTCGKIQGIALRGWRGVGAEWEALGQTEFFQKTVSNTG